MSVRTCSIRDLMIESDIPLLAVLGPLHYRNIRHQILGLRTNINISQVQTATSLPGGLRRSFLTFGSWGILSLPLIVTVTKRGPDDCDELDGELSSEFYKKLNGKSDTKNDGQLTLPDHGS